MRKRDPRAQEDPKSQMMENCGHAGEIKRRTQPRTVLQLKAIPLTHVVTQGPPGTQILSGSLAPPRRRRCGVGKWERGQAKSLETQTHLTQGALPSSFSLSLFLFLKLTLTDMHTHTLHIYPLGNHSPTLIHRGIWTLVDKLSSQLDEDKGAIWWRCQAESQRSRFSSDLFHCLSLRVGLS